MQMVKLSRETYLESALEYSFPGRRQCAVSVSYKDGHLLSGDLRDNQACRGLGVLTYFTQWVAGGVSVEAGIQHDISCSRLLFLLGA